MRSSVARSAVAGAVLAALVLLVSACSSGAQPGVGGPTTVRASVGSGFGALPVILAVEKGYFGANGLDVELTEGRDHAAYLAAMGQQFDIVMGFPTAILQAVGQRVPLTVVSGLQRTDAGHANNPVIVRQDSQIRSSADLVGKTVGVPTLTGIAADAVRYLVRRQGGTENVKLVVVPPDAMGDQLRAGRIDAAISAIPFYTALQDNGFRVLDDVVVTGVQAATRGAQGAPLLTTFLTTPTFADERPDVLAAWRRSLRQGIDFARANEAEARAILQKHYGLTDDVARDAPLPVFDIAVAPADFEPYVTISTTVGSLKSAPDLAGLIHQGA